MVPEENMRCLSTASEIWFLSFQWRSTVMTCHCTALVTITHRDTHPHTYTHVLLFTYLRLLCSICPHHSHLKCTYVLMHKICITSGKASFTLPSETLWQTILLSVLRAMTWTEISGKQSSTAICGSEWQQRQDHSSARVVWLADDVHRGWERCELGPSFVTQSSIITAQPEGTNRSLLAQLINVCLC
jgi:hypothetical protein